MTIENNEKNIRENRQNIKDNTKKLQQVSEDTAVNKSDISNLKKYDAKQNGSIQKLEGHVTTITKSIGSIQTDLAVVKDVMAFLKKLGFWFLCFLITGIVSLLISLFNNFVAKAG